MSMTLDEAIEYLKGTRYQASAWSMPEYYYEEGSDFKEALDIVESYARKSEEIERNKNKYKDKCKAYEIYSVQSEMWKCDERFPNQVVLRIQYTSNLGFGQIDFFYNTETNEWGIDTEYMSEGFCLAVLDKWLHGIYSGEQKLQKLEED